MTREVAALLAVNALVLAAGAGLLPLLGAARSGRELAGRVGLAYLVGLAAVGIVAATLALVRVPLGWGGLAALAAVSLAAGLPRLRGGGAPPSAARTRVDAAVAVVGSVALALVLVRAWPAFVAAPVEAWDAWAIWVLKGRALFELGWADPVLFANPAYADFHPAYPLLVPALQAVGFRAMGGFDPQAVHVQSLLFGVALVGGLHGVLRDRTHSWVLWPTLVAVAAAPGVSLGLLTGYADVPLAAFVGVAAAAGGRWLLWRERWALAVAALLLAAALLTKFEAPLFVGGVLVALGLASLPHGRAALLPLAAAAAAAAVPLALWRVYVAVHGLGTGHAGPGELTFIPGVGPIALEWLLRSALTPSVWALLAPLFAGALALGLAAGSRPLALYALVATALPLGGLVANYVLSPIPYAVYLEATADRVIASIVLAGAALVPLLVAEAATRPRRRPQEGRPAGTAP